MFRSGRRFSYANVAATLALFFSMSGGALAASHYLITSTKQINPKVLKALKGKTGAAGLTGAIGTTGATGATGAPGATGKEGSQGKEGKEGPAGPFVTEVPPGKTITGSYGLETPAAGAEFVGANVSYPFPIGAPPTGVFVELGETAAHCPGKAESPKAEAGYLCIYRGFVLNISAGTPDITNHFGERNGKGDSYGFEVEDTSEGAGVAIDEGTWAYTAP